MTITTHKKSRSKYAELTGKDHGRVRISLGTTSARQAARLAKLANLKEIEQAAKAGRLAHETITRLNLGRRVTLRQAVAGWHEAASMRGESEPTAVRNLAFVNQWLATLPGLEKKSPLAAEASHIYNWINSPDAGVKASRDRKLNALRSLFRYMVDSGLSTANPARLVRVNARALSQAQREPRKWRPFTAAEVRTLLASLDLGHGNELFFYLASAISHATAMRLGDVASLEWDTLTQPNHIIVWTDKRDRRICLPIDEKITPGLAAALGRVPHNDTPFLFPEQKARYDDVSGRAWFSVTFGRLLGRAGVKGPGKSFHSLRHTALTRWDAQGFSLEQCAEFAGHTDTRTTEGYIHRKK